jgi:HEPN domain-containing protein
VNRKDFQRLAETRLADAQALLKNRRYDGAYYLAGYAVECALKACIAKRTKRYDFPDRELTKAAYTHKLTDLLKNTGVSEAVQQEFRDEPALDGNWGVVKDWSEESRYETHGRKKARDMLRAVGHQQGVLACIRRYW